MGYNLLVFASSIKRLAFVSFVLGYYAHGQRLVGYLEDKNPWVDPVPHFFLRSDASRHPVGYICWDFLFYVVVGFIGVGRNGKTLSTTFTNLTRPSVEKWTLAIHYLHGWDNDKGRSGDICDVAEATLLQRKGRREQEEEAAFAFEITPVAGYRGKDL
jgi:hypothetical protein